MMREIVDIDMDLSNFKIYEDKIITLNGTQVFFGINKPSQSNIKIAKLTDTSLFFDTGTAYQLDYVSSQGEHKTYGAWKTLDEVLSWTNNPTDIDVLAIIREKLEKTQKKSRESYNYKEHDIFNYSDFSLKNEYIYYKSTELISSVSPSIDEYKFIVIQESGHDLYFEDGILFTVKITDELGDSFHYGVWNTLDEVQFWIDNA